MKDCVFCSIVNGDGSTLVWQNKVAVAVNTIHPMTPVHVLVMPRQHIQTLDEVEDAALAGQLLMAVKEVAEKVGLKGRWRLRVNNGRSVGQTIDHLHFHIQGGQELTE